MQTYYKQLCGQFERELIEVRRIIADKSAFLRSFGIDNSPFSSGKLLRPILCFCSQHTISPSTITYAAAVEIVHNASLIHDDIIDRGQTRRLLPTFQRTYGRETAVLAGDALMGAAFKLCITGCDNGRTLELSNAVNAMCAAELQQQLAIKENRFSAQESLNVIEGKTGSLFKACAYGCCEDTRAAAGLCGMAYQISNDISGIETDLSNGLKTLPLILGGAGEAGIERCRSLGADEANRLLDKARNYAEPHSKIGLFISMIRELIEC